MMANFEYRLFLYPPSNEIGRVEGIQELSENKRVVYNIQYHSFLYPLGPTKEMWGWGGGGIPESSDS